MIVRGVDLKADAKISNPDADLAKLSNIVLAKKDLISNSSDDVRDYAPDSKKRRFSEDESDGSGIVTAVNPQANNVEFQSADAQNFFSKILKTENAQHPLDDQQLSEPEAQFTSLKIPVTDNKVIWIQSIMNLGSKLFYHRCGDGVCNLDDFHWLVMVGKPETKLQSDELLGHYSRVLSEALGMSCEEAKKRIYLGCKSCYGFGVVLDGWSMHLELSESSSVKCMMQDCLWSQRINDPPDSPISPVSEDEDEEYNWALDLQYLMTCSWFVGEDEEIFEDEKALKEFQEEVERTMPKRSVGPKDVKERSGPPPPPGRSTW